VAYFSWLKSTLFFFHVSHATHHVLTSKTPPQTHLFLASPLQKAQQNATKAPPQTGQIFFA
jgi:hypothetical protein